MARGRRTRGRRGRRRRFVRRGIGRKMQSGGMIRGRMHPPSNTASPWNNYVVTFLWNPTPGNEKVPFNTMQALTSGNIRDRVREELGISGAIDMRIRRIDVWTQPQTSNSTRNCVVMAPFDFVKCEALISWFESWGTSVQPAHCHYMWPKSTSNVVIADGNNCRVLQFDVRDANFAYIIKCHLMWRKSSPNPLKICEGVVTSLRTFSYEASPSPDNYVMVDGIHAMSPLADVVGACNLRP